jgi:branched-chain amino acid transport system permease protein
MLAVGYVLQRSVLARSLRGGELIPLLTTFGIAIALQNLLQEGFSTDPKNLGQYAGSVATGSWHITSQLAIPYMGVIVLLVAVGVLGGLQYMLSSTAFGREMRATAQDIDTAGLVGIPAASVYARATAIAIATAGLAGLFLGIRSGVNPTIGPSALIFAFEVVIIGGLGSLWGTLWGGVVLGVAQATGAYLLQHRFGLDWQLLTGHLVFFVVLLAPRLRLAYSHLSGLLPRKAVA